MAQISQQELDEIYAFALDIGKRAGKLLLDGVDKRIGGVDGSGELAFTEKDNAVDIVTKTDEGLLYNPFFTAVVLRRSISFLSYTEVEEVSLICPLSLKIYPCSWCNSPTHKPLMHANHHSYLTISNTTWASKQLLTQIVIDVEGFIRSAIQERYPSHKFVQWTCSSQQIYIYIF